jgi:diguanylate cyclase (GGDEF)-like protein
VGDGRIHVTVSIGVACKEPAMTGEEAMVSAADKALYAAKQAGRDRTCLSSGGKLRCGHT